jgi:tetratricopeptide (TPR) repeat protein
MSAVSESSKFTAHLTAALRWAGIGVVLVAIGPSPVAWSAPQQQGQQKPAAQAGGSSSQENSTFNPLPAEQDVEVGTFYLHKGDVDAAIARFQDAVRLRPNFAKARLLLAEAYEKKGDRAAAVKCYQEYLQVFPNAPDAKKIKKKIERLSAPKR